MFKCITIFITSALVLNLNALEIITNPNDYKWISDNEYSFQKQTAKERGNRKVASNSELNDVL